MFKFAISLLLLLEPLLSSARPQYFCAIPCPLTKPCNPGFSDPCSNSCYKYPSNSNYCYDDESYGPPCPINLTVNCCSDGGGGGNGENKPNCNPPIPGPPPLPPAPQTETPPTQPTPPTPPTPPTQPTPPPQSRSGDDGVSYRRSGGRSNMLTSLFSIPGAVADTFLSGEVTL